MAVADALVSKVVDMLVSTIAEEFRRVAGVEEEVQKLTYSLQSIQAVLVDAERRKLKEATVQLWLDRLKNVAYDADDVVDEWSYEILRLQTKRDENAHKPTSKVWCLCLFSACYSFPKVVLRHHMAAKIIDLNARLDVIAIEKDRYGFQSFGTNIAQVERIITTSDISISEVKGRETDKEKLVSIMLSGTSEMPKLRLIPMVGMGGIGKTTLARLVFNDERVKSHFYERIWVCVSDPFDEIRIGKEILESLQDGNSNLAGLPNIMKKIQESFVEGKEYLFVLDDVWKFDPRKWKQLEDCLKGSSSKSTILVTTRNEDVGRMMSCLESDIFQVGFLSDEECWDLFCMIAFSRRSREERASLEEIGKEAVRRCNGLPLAVRTIAGLLQFKKPGMEWQRVLDSELWNSEEVQTPLWLSYYDLPSPLKQCFSYYAVFPKDGEMEKGELIRCWMAQGYIQGTHSKDEEIIGDEYFQNLVMRSLIQNAKVEEDRLDVGRTRFKMHDIVHDFAQKLVKKECLSIEVIDDSEAISLDDSVGNLLRHLNISFRNEVRCPDSFYNLKKLRSLMVSSLVSWHRSKTIGLNLNKIFDNFTSLRLLSLRDCGIVEVPSNINRLVHLRELDLSWNVFLQALPDTLWELYNLKILILDRCEGVSSVKGLERLTNLRHLGNFGVYFLCPKEMVRLNGLRRLNWVNIDVNNEEAFSLKHLKNFNHLNRSLVIRWLNQGDGDVEDAKQAQLKDKKYITHLVLLFDQLQTETSTKQDGELLEALNVPPNLETLEVRHYKGLRIPNWLDSLTVVTMVKLDYWDNCKRLPSLGKLPCLEDLRLWGFYRVRKVGAEFLGMDKTVLSSSSTIVPLFPKLTSLHFSFFQNWAEWNDVDADGDKEMFIMPSLTCLKIDSCYKLKALPNFILRKNDLKLDIEYCQALRVLGAL